MAHHEPPLLAITRAEMFYEAQLVVLKDIRLLLQKLLTQQTGEKEEGGNGSAV
jgi:hypothetical protein